MQRRILIIIRRPAKRDTVSLRRSSLNINNPDDACDTAKFLATLDIAMELIERALFWAVIAVYGLGGVAVVAGFALCALTMEKADITEYFASLVSSSSFFTCSSTSRLARIPRSSKSSTNAFNLGWRTLSELKYKIMAQKELVRSLSLTGLQPSSAALAWVEC